LASNFFDLEISSLSYSLFSVLRGKFGTDTKNDASS
jgi:hypothetical protein